MIRCGHRSMHMYESQATDGPRKRPRRQPIWAPGILQEPTRGRKPRVMDAIGMLVMPEFFTYRSLQRMTGGSNKP